MKSEAVSFIGLNGFYDSISELRKSLGLTFPGTIEQISRESQDVQLTRLMFTGIKAEINKVGSINPAIFQLGHSFASGSQVLPPYSLNAVYATNSVLMNGTVDNDGSVSGRLNLSWAGIGLARNTTKFQTQTTAEPGQSMLQVEHDYSGDDFSLSVKTVNPSFLDGEFSGVSVGHYLQSITPSLALGLEAVWQKPPSTAGPEETAIAYFARYVQPSWIATAQFSPQGILSANFFKQLNEQVSAGVECQLIKVQGPMGQTKSEGSTTFAAKYQFMQSVLRGQIDTKGKLSCLFEKQLSGAVSLTFAASIDHLKGGAALGMGLNLEMPAFDDPSMGTQ